VGYGLIKHVLGKAKKGEIKRDNDAKYRIFLPTIRQNQHKWRGTESKLEHFA
jgi:hypothetical protein